MDSRPTLIAKKIALQNCSSPPFGPGKENPFTQRTPLVHTNKLRTFAGTPAPRACSGYAGAIGPEWQAPALYQMVANGRTGNGYQTRQRSKATPGIARG